MKTIQIPDNLEINLDKLKELGILTEKPENLKYDDVLKTLEQRNEAKGNPYYHYVNSLPLYNDEIAKSLVDLVKLINTAKYLNGDWKPNRVYTLIVPGVKYFFRVVKNNIHITYSDNDDLFTSLIYFKTKELAQQAIDILGEDTIKNALTLNY